MSIVLDDTHWALVIACDMGGVEVAVTVDKWAHVNVSTIAIRRVLLGSRNVTDEAEYLRTMGVLKLLCVDTTWYLFPGPTRKRAI